ncbi:MAG: peptide-binding protein [Desulfobacteraceae bacterium]|jgi:ABC-type transport system substrate-binding protein
MSTRRILILAPLILIAFLLQSYFWVPSYEDQTRGNPHRLKEYIDGSIGDASLLNPILPADTSSSDITGLVFEGLIDRDRDLSFRGRLAESWEIYEVAQFYVNEQRTPPGAAGAGAEAVADLIERARSGEIPLDEDVQAALANIRQVEVLPPEERTETVPSRSEDKASPGREVRVHAPARMRLTLSHVDQDLFDRLAAILGEDYFQSFPSGKFLALVSPQGDGLSTTDRARLGRDLLPAVEHNPVILFHLRPGVQFHDGHLVDAHDVAFTYQAIMNPDNLSPRAADYEPVKQVEVVDPLTVRVVYKRLYSPALTTWSMGVLPEHLLNEEALRQEALRLGKDPESFTMRQSRFNRDPIGCGPFRFKEWRSDQYILLDRFEDYWEGAPNYERYVYRIIPDPLTQEMEYYAGTLDSYGVLPHQVERLKEDSRFQSFSGLSFGYTYIGYNMRRKPFDDPRVRRALGMAIDVEKIIRYVLYGQAERITGPFAKQTDFYNHAIQPLPYDPEGAARLLEDAGWQRNKDGWLEKDGKPLQFTLITNNGNDLRKAILAVAQDAWRGLGIDVRTDLLEWSVFIQERVDRADFDALVLGWSMGIEPDLFQIWHSSQTDTNELNFVGFKNTEADDLIVKIRQEYDHEQQVAYCHRLHEIIAREQPYTFLYVGRWTAVLDKRIVIQETDAQGNVLYRKIQPTRTGSYRFDLNRWIKLSHAPDFASR